MSKRVQRGGKTWKYTKLPSGAKIYTEVSPKTLAREYALAEGIPIPGPEPGQEPVSRRMLYDRLQELKDKVDALTE